MSNKNFCVAISGKSGCGNTTVSTLLADRLAYQLVNYTFHTIAEERGIPFEEVCRQAEQDTKWDYFVDETQIRLAREKDSVLGSRLAIWLMQDADLKVFLTASREVRASRIHTREGGSVEDKLNETDKRDKRDHDRYRKLYNIDNNKYDFADLIINTERLLPEQIVTIIESAITAKINQKKL